MGVSYKKLWKLLIDHDMSRAELRRAIGASTATIAKMKKGTPVSSDVLMRICNVLGCDFGDIVEFVPGADNGSRLSGATVND